MSGREAVIADLLAHILRDVAALQQAFPTLSIQADVHTNTRFVLFDQSGVTDAEDGAEFARSVDEWMMDAFRSSRALYTRTIRPNGTSRVWFLNPGVTPELVRFMVTGALSQARLERLRAARVQLLYCTLDRASLGSTTSNVTISLQRFDGVEAPEDVDLR
jgi:hypothetical protein